MREIAAASGIRSSSLYHHFPSKEDMLEQVLERGIGTTISRVREAIETIPADRPFAERLRAAVLEHLAEVNDPDAFAVGSIQSTRLPFAVMQRYDQRRRAYDALWTTLISQGIACGAVSAASASGVIRVMIYGALNWSAEWLQPDRGSLGRIADIATTFILDGLTGVDANS
jgi:AcrR family transcriptional regulator